MRKALSATQAKQLLEREFAHLRSPECKTCKAPTPFWGPGAFAGTGYWYLKMLAPCPHRCNRVINRVWAQITTEYQIERSAAESGSARYQGALAANDAPARRRVANRAEKK